MPDNLKIEPSKTTLGVSLDAVNNLIRFEGVSYPTNPIEFFQPIIGWVDEYVASVGSARIVIDFHLKYINTTSSSYILKVLEPFDVLYKQYQNVNVSWYYTEEDEDLLDSARSIWSELDLPLNIKKVSE